MFHYLKIKQKWFFVVCVGAILFCLFFFIYVSTHMFQGHSNIQQERVKGTVVRAQLLEQTKDTFQTFVTQRLFVQIRENKTLKQVSVTYSSDSLALHPLQIGDEVLLTKTVTESGTEYHFHGRYRLSRLFSVITVFFFFIILVTGKRGLGALIGLFVSILIITYYIIPGVLAGQNPLQVCISGAMVIMVISMYLAHGISSQSTTALVATLIALCCTLLISFFLTQFVLLSGYGNQDTYLIHQVGDVVINIKALLIGGILIATLGALDDVTMAQAATVFELAKTKKELTIRELFQKGMTVGREHALSLINTLIIAYFGSSFVVFFSYFVFYRNESILAILNREPIAEEIVKSIAISTGLILAVPIVTLLAAVVVKNKYKLLWK